MQRKSNSILKLAACLALMTSLAASAADISGTYIATREGRQGGQPQKLTLVLKAAGDKLTGTFLTPQGGRRGGADGAPPPAPMPIEIKDGMVKGDDISFSVTREGRGGGNPVTIKYAGKVSGDKIKMKWEQPGRGGGDPTPVELEFTKEAAK